MQDLFCKEMDFGCFPKHKIQKTLTNGGLFLRSEKKGVIHKPLTSLLVSFCHNCYLFGVFDFL
jgi:hypothetical protein